MLEQKDYSLAVELTFENSEVPVLYGGPLGDQEYYRFVSYHYHWGLEDEEGSEHTINGKPYPFEGHFIFQNVKYKNISEALVQSDGLAVVGKLYSINQAAELLPLIDDFQQMIESDVQGTQFKPVEFLTFESIFGSQSFAYAHYLGSLSTPPCSEAVSWFVSLNVASISPMQVRTII